MAEKSYKTIRTFRGNGTQTTFNFNFRFLRKTFVTVKVDNTDKAYGVDYTVTNTEEVVFFTAPPAGSLIIIKRVTQTAPMVSWADGSVLLAKDLGLQGTQLFHIQEEVSDAVQTDAAENADIAQRSANAAKVSETNSATNAQTAIDKAKDSADSAVEAQAAETRAKGYATSAATDAGTATTKAAEALVSATAAKTSENEAESAEQRVIAMENTIKELEKSVKALNTATSDLVAGHTIYVPTYPVGAPFFWPTGAARPNGTLVCDGSAFSLGLYPELALVYPDGILPDMRGVVPRGLDRGRGLDPDGAARQPKSYQGDTYQSHGHETWINAAGQPIGGEGQAGRLTTVWRLLAPIDTAQGRVGLTSNTGFTETRGKNIAGDWLVYASTLKYDLTVEKGNALSLGGYPAIAYFRKGDPKTATVAQRLPAGVGGGFAVANNTYINRVLDTIVNDNIGVTLKDNVITLPAGSYEITASAQFYATGVGLLQLAVDTAALSQVAFYARENTTSGGTASVQPVVSGFYTSGSPIKVQMFYRLTNEQFLSTAENLGIGPRAGMVFSYNAYVNIKQL